MVEMNRENGSFSSGTAKEDGTELLAGRRCKEVAAWQATQGRGLESSFVLPQPSIPQSPI